MKRNTWISIMAVIVAVGFAFIATPSFAGTPSEDFSGKWTINTELSEDPLANAPQQGLGKGAKANKKGDQKGRMGRTQRARKNVNKCDQPCCYPQMQSQQRRTDCCAGKEQLGMGRGRGHHQGKGHARMGRGQGQGRGGNQANKGPKFHSSITNLQVGRNEVTIKATKEKVRFELANGRTYEVNADGKLQQMSSPMGSVNVNATWDDDALVVNTVCPNGRFMSRTYSLDDDGRLKVVTRVQPRFRPEPVVFASVYDPSKG